MMKEDNWVDLCAAATLLAAMANPNRLRLLKLLDDNGEIQVGVLAEQLGLSQSALSQHLLKLKELGLVEYRRSSQRMFYSLRCPEVRRMLRLLEDIYCKEEAA